MKGVQFNEFGDVGVLSYGNLDDPPVYADQVGIEVRAAGVNPSDVAVRSGYLQTAFAHFLPVVPGVDVAGEIVEVPPTVRGFASGDAVMALALRDYVQQGTYAERASVPVRLIARKPENLSFVEAAALPTSGLGALQSLRFLEAGRGDVVLVHAAAGGVGHLAVQLAQTMGAKRVIGTASPANHDFVRSLGAEVVDYGEGLAERIAEVAGGDGKVDAVLDPFGGESLDVSFDRVRSPRRLVCLTPFGVLERGGQVLGVTPNAADLAEVAGMVSRGELRVEVQETMPLERAADAHRLIEARHVRGKVVLTV